MPQHLDPFGSTNEDQPKYETGQNLYEDGPQLNEIPFPTLDTEEDGNGPQNEDFENVPMPSPCDERLLDEALNRQRDEMEADNLMFDQYDDAAQQEKQHPQGPLTWKAIKHWAECGNNAHAFITDRIAEAIADNIEAFGDLIVTKHYIRAVAKSVLESALTNDTPVVTLRRSGDSIIIAGKGKADLVVDVLNCANTPAKPAPLADTEERLLKDECYEADEPELDTYDVVENFPDFQILVDSTYLTRQEGLRGKVRSKTQDQADMIYQVDYTDGSTFYVFSNGQRHDGQQDKYDLLPRKGARTYADADTEERHPDDGVLGDDNDPEGLKEWRKMWGGIGKTQDLEA